MVIALYGVTFDQFAGLDLADAANEAGGAIDMLNCDLDVRGRVRARDGFTKFSTAAAPSAFLGLQALPNFTATGQIIGGLTTFGTNSVRVVDATTGVVVATTGAGATLPVLNFTLMYDTVNGTRAYYASHPGTATWDGAAFTVVGGINHTYVNTTPVDNRLMFLCRTGVAGVDPGSNIYFSDPGSPFTFPANPFVQLNPGDGESIRAVCNFANQVFVFKESRFFVFTGVTTDASGNPIFNYRTINTGIGVHPVGQGGGCCAAPDGVYFFGKDGIYKTTGGAPAKISGAIDPLFGVGGPMPPYFQGQAVSYASASRAYMQFYKNRLYITYDGASARGMLVYDIPTGQWYYWGTSANGMCANPTSGALTFAYAGLASPTSTADLGAFSTSATTDAGTAITGRYRSGYVSFDYAGRTIKRGIQGVEKTIREAIVDGMGTVNFRLAKQWVQPGNLPTAQALTLGTSPQVAQARARSAGNVRGRMFSYQLDGTAPWTVEKLVLNLRDFASVGVQKSGN